MIICCGEALMDMLPRKLADGNEAYLPVPGGAIFNTTLALGRLGEKVGFLSSISTDMFGDQLLDFLRESDVDTTQCIRLENPTTLAFVKLEAGQAQYSFFDENSAMRNLEAQQLPRLADSVSALHFGAISLIPEPCGSAYEALMVNNANKVLSLDPNIRNGFISDPEGHRARILRMIALADIVKVSDEDLKWIAAGGSQEAMVQNWLDKGATSIVLVTEGDKGVTAHIQTGKLQLPAMQVKVVDTIGAGDTFNAGFLAGLVRSELLNKDRLRTVTLEDLKPALNLASKVAALTVSKAGANPPWQSEL